ncbi:MAG: RNA polymerase sigma factor [Gammaproteobacteria bacterium]
MEDPPSQLELDRRLVARILRGDSAAFDTFFDTYFPRLTRFALARTDGNHAMAEDVAQKTLCDVMYKMDQFRGDSSLLTWLCQICRNTLATEYRRHSTDPARHTLFEDSPAVQSALEAITNSDYQPENARTAADINRLVQLVLDHLPLRYARALEMKYIEGERTALIARSLEISDKAAESLLARARTAFRDGFESLYGIDAKQVLK